MEDEFGGPAENGESSVPWWALSATLIVGVVLYTALGGWSSAGEASLAPLAGLAIGQIGAAMIVATLLRRRGTSRRSVS